MNEKKIEYIRSKRLPFGIGDVIVFVAAIALTVVLLLTLPGEKGNGVEIVYSGGRIVLPLDTDTERRVDGHLTVVIENGKCRVTESDCENRICVKTGAIGRVGESIVCARNKIVITVIGQSKLAGTVGQ